ncbi:transforming growth factor-beta receptor-associated protein 1 isoform X1 [Electrophorus electricus]|uniref:transforming growth factor-beta receptor-associated protein 1 isoform X1 n=1 Tax=Electrophorus electricus TaxID=8005 RepID=UPI0015D0670B|nr:transforming growth factor-beta receptor-associated protein 1 isoform X1 [Electrophorus electricus]
MSIFSSALVFEEAPAGKGKTKSTLQCVEFFCNNLYVGRKNAVIQHFAVTDSSRGESPRVQEVWRRQVGRGGTVTQLKTVPVLNHLLVLCDGTVTVVNMFSLEPVPGLKSIQNVSLFYAGEPAAQAQPVFVKLFIACARRRTVCIYRVCVDRWECVGQVLLPQDPVALVVHETRLCVATSDRYILHDYLSQSTLKLFTHNMGKQNVIVKESVKGEFLLNGPGNLGMFVMQNGISQRPPVQWPEGVLDAAVQYPYLLALQSQTLHIYSMLDQQLKQTISIQRGKALLSTSESVFVVAEQQIHCLSQTPLGDQVQSLLEHERVEEALTLLDGVQALLPGDCYKELHRKIVRTSGWINFYKEAFPEAIELFIKSELDPREIISVYPSMVVIVNDFEHQLPAVSNVRDLWQLNQEDRTTFQQYLSFLSHFLREVRGTAQGQICPREVDTALLKLYLEQGDYGNLNQLVSAPNHCVLHVCEPDLQHHKRFFAIGLLYQSQGQPFNAIQTWARIVDGEGDSSQTVLLHIVKTLSQLKQKSVILETMDWVLLKDQKAGALIFTKRDPDTQSMFAPNEVLTILTHYPIALTSYLEFLVHDLHSKEEKHHTLLAVTYATRILETAKGMQVNDVTTQETREKLQQFLWQSSIYDTSAIHAKIKSSHLHVEKAILLGRAGEHQKALQVLVNQEKDVCAAETYCWRTSAGQDRKCTQQLFLCLLQIYLGSGHHVTAAVDLLNNNAMAFNPARVLEVLPGSWSLQLVMHFLRESLRATTHERRLRGLEKSLAKVENLRQKCAWMEAAHEKVKLDRSCVCHCCQRQLTGPEFLRRPTSEVIHIHCYSED